MKAQNYIKRIKNALYPQGFQYDRWRTWRISQFINRCGSNSLIVEIGSQERNTYGKIINLEISLYPNVDIVADGCYLPFKDKSLTGIIVRGVLEHVAMPQVIIQEIHRTLKNKGVLYLEVPFIQGFHAAPGDYQRYTLVGLEYLCSSFDKIESGVCGGPASATAWILHEFLSQLFSLGNKWLKRKMNILFGWICLPMKYLDFFMCRNPSAWIISSGFYFLGEKTNKIAEVSKHRS
jgi:SAM-dependent methyltransferase